MSEKRKCKYYHYFVEGEDEEKIVKTLKTDLQMIAPGKIQRFNVIQEKLTKYRLLTLKKVQQLFWYLILTREIFRHY